MATAEQRRARAQVLRERIRLNILVTEAICRMDRYYGRGPHPLPAAGTALGLYVSRLEEMIAAAHDHGSVEQGYGEAGAVQAAVRAGFMLRAVRLSARFSGDSLELYDRQLRTELEYLWGVLLSEAGPWQPVGSPRGVELLTW